MATVITSLETHLVDELADLLDAETQLTEALPKLAQAATAAELRAAFTKHLKETRGHVARLNQALRRLGQTKPKSKTCEGMQGLLEEGESMMKKTPAGALRDAVMITGAQKVEHYEMASYGTVRTYAQVLGEPVVARLLEQTLNEEKAADRALTAIAEHGVNEDAAEEWQAKEEAGSLIKTAEWVGATAGYASRQLSKGLRTAASVVGVASNGRSKRRQPQRTKHRTARPRQTAGRKSSRAR